MCRILTLVGIKQNKDYLEDLMFSASEHMSKFNDDGIGYTMITKDSKLHTRKWLNNTDFFTTPPKIDSVIKKNLKGFIKDNADVSKTHFVQGKTPNYGDIQTLMMHTRKATCGKGIENTHPFVTKDNQVSLIHNGQISNHTVFNKTLGTCDSESILSGYLDFDVANNPSNIQKLFDKLYGSFAVAVTAVDNTGRRVIDVFRNDSYATLYVAYSKFFGCYMICTRDDIISNINKDMSELNISDDPNKPIPLDLGLGNSLEVKDYVYCRFDALTGEVLHNFEVKKERTWPSFGSHFRGANSTTSGSVDTSQAKTFLDYHNKFNDKTGQYDSIPVEEVSALSDVNDIPEVTGIIDLLTKEEIEELDNLALELNGEEKAILEALDDENEYYEWLSLKMGWNYSK